MAEKKQEVTGANTHRATRRGYADHIVEAGAMVPEGVPVADVEDDPIHGWMEALDKKTARMAQAAEEATDPKPKDVDYTQLSVEALQALAAERGINVDGLKKGQLIDAIKAAHADTA